MIHFYLGTHQPSWLAHAGVPLFVSHRRLSGRKTLPRARAGWALDSGGFSELSLFGEWRTSPEDYVAAVRRYDEEIGKLEWAAPQDWMCEPVMLAKTGLTVAEHQRRTVVNFLRLQEVWGDRYSCPFMPVLQGWNRDDYLRCLDLYGAHGVDFTEYPVVGLGSVCRRQATGEIGAVVTALRAVDPGMALHGFGVKKTGLAAYGHMLTAETEHEFNIGSADSMAWSFDARRHGRPRCGGTGHKNCANCLPYALTWRGEVLAAIGSVWQLDLFTSLEGEEVA
ncbi:DUF7221 family queuine tRNA-ribosyltransferase-like protein [Amycolatopsis taiwanensis]|uniref:deazapurine DNA modification protein DpdA family protein n=1 Tax=Amycolatopsis taiwanensis TaxID=342230 RepID=UPI0004BAAD66|nr:hypothetical protein [Amycolatopsis taiwanensis]